MDRSPRKAPAANFRNLVGSPGITTAETYECVMTTPVERQRPRR